MGVQWTGLAEFRQELRNLPAHLADEAGRIVVEAARDAERDVSTAYPEVTGNLKRGVKTSIDVQSGLGASARVRSGAPHAHLYEYGYTRKGRGTATKIPQAAIPVFIRARRIMVEKLIRLVQSTGLKVESS